MGLLQKAVETYDSHFAFASENRIGTAMMAPVGHIVTRADLEITLSQEGKFIEAVSIDKSEPKIIIPATESSAGRTSAPCAHPLCDQIGYLNPDNKTKFNLYVEQLSSWVNSDFSHPKLKSVLTYVKSGTIVADLVRVGVIKVNTKKQPENEKLLVRWRILGDSEPACWLDQTLFDTYTAYSNSINTACSALCIVSGFNAPTADQHPKGIIPIKGNAKLISANDSSGFTYRGRFTDETQAATISYIVSQKAHSALRWLAQEQGVILGGRTFLCWNPQGQQIAHPMYSLLWQQKPIFRPSQYREAVRNVLNSKKAELKLTDGVVLAAFDAATTGRLSLTYYNELQGQDFLQRLHDWDSTCCWEHRFYGIQSPSLKQIIDCAFGSPRTEKGTQKLETDERVLCQQMQRLIACRVERSLIGADIVRALVNRASRLLIYEDYLCENILSTACAVVKKYRHDRFKEEWNMALEPERMDRSYQFGRLLAVMEKVERDTYSNEEGREPNAIRLQSVFCQRPLYAAKQLEAQLERAYFPRLTPGIRSWYKSLIGQIMQIISCFPQEEWNKPLTDTYLMGYYLQRSDLYTKKNNNDTEENNHE